MTTNTRYSRAEKIDTLEAASGHALGATKSILPGGARYTIFFEAPNAMTAEFNTITPDGTEGQFSDIRGSFSVDEAVNKMFNTVTNGTWIDFRGKGTYRQIAADGTVKFARRTSDGTLGKPKEYNVLDNGAP